MAETRTPANPLFLRDDDLRQGIELLFFAYRDFTAKADETLLQYGFGRAHHRVIYFVGLRCEIAIGEKQQLNPLPQVVVAEKQRICGGFEIGHFMSALLTYFSEAFKFGPDTMLI